MPIARDPAVRKRDTAQVRFERRAFRSSRSSGHLEIVADAAWHILTRPSRECTGEFFVDEAVLRHSGVTDFSSYAVAPGAALQPDFFL